MLLTSDILDEKDKRIRDKNTDMEFPLNDKEYAVLKYCASAKSFDEVLVRALYLHSLLV